MIKGFISQEPEIFLVNSFARSFDNVVATARTCYSPSGIITAEQAAGDDIPEGDEKRQREERRTALAKDIYKAGHHTTFQHAHFQFAMSNISRHFVWSFLHSHPFYNSEQVSQRYVEVKPGSFLVPELKGKALLLYENCIQRQLAAYKELIELLIPVVESEYFKIFKSRSPHQKKWRLAIKKKAQEIARYVLPVATFTYMYHTVSGITLLRYYRLCQQWDVPLEQKIVVRKMVDELLRLDPLYQDVLEEPLSFEETLEYEVFQDFMQSAKPSQNGIKLADRFKEEFDRQLEGKISKLVSYKNENEQLLADGVREVLGVPKKLFSDEDAIESVLNPARNNYLGESLNLTSMAKLTRAMVHPHYTFKKKLSHTADSQDQRHRLTPASRPCLLFHLSDEPDYITPELIKSDSRAQKLYDECMDETWDVMGKLKQLSVPDEFISYLLPNAVSVRFTESTDLMNVWHKHAMRLCYNAQEEIWRASQDEALQIRDVNPRIGKYLLPPCTLRDMAEQKPVCPEGERFCGVRVWTMDVSEYKRLL